MSTGVSIVGAGLSKFGRQPGRTGRELALDAIAAALPTPGSSGPTSRSRSAAATASGLADTLVADLGLTGIPFTNVKNGCATGGSALMSAVQRDPVRRRRDRARRGLRQAPARRVRPAARGLGPARGVRRGRPDGDHPVLRHQDRPLPARARHQRADPGPGRGEGLPQRCAQPQRLAARADLGRRDRRRGHGQRPADPVHVLLARRGWRRDRRRQRRRGCRASVARCSCSARPPAPGASAPSRCSAPRSRAGRPSSVSTDAAAAAFAAAGVGPDGRRRRPAAGHRERRRDHAPGRVRLLRARRAGGDDRRRRDRDRWPAAGQHRRRLHRERRADRRLGAAPGPRDRHPAARRGGGPPGRRHPRIGFTHVYGAPGISACTVLAV